MIARSTRSKAKSQVSHATEACLLAPRLQPAAVASTNVKEKSGESTNHDLKHSPHVGFPPTFHH